MMMMMMMMTMMMMMMMMIHDDHPAQTHSEYLLEEKLTQTAKEAETFLVKWNQVNKYLFCQSVSAQVLGPGQILLKFAK